MLVMTSPAYTKMHCTLAKSAPATVPIPRPVRRGRGCAFRHTLRMRTVSPGRAKGTKTARPSESRPRASPPYVNFSSLTVSRSEVMKVQVSRAKNAEQLCRPTSVEMVRPIDANVPGGDCSPQEGTRNAYFIQNRPKKLVLENCQHNQDRQRTIPARMPIRFRSRLMMV